MRKRLKTATGAAAALVALALGGSAIASATQSTQGNGAKPAVKHAAVKHAAAKHSAVKHSAVKSAENATGPDTDSIQSGDQTSPDTNGATAGSAAAPATPGAESSSETSSESSSESATPSDGPGGHEDPPGEVDHQSETEE